MLQKSKSKCIIIRVSRSVYIRRLNNRLPFIYRLICALTMLFSDNILESIGLIVILKAGGTIHTSEYTKTQSPERERERERESL